MTKTHATTVRQSVAHAVAPALFAAHGRGDQSRASRELLGIGRNTIGQWLHQYERGGLQALLTLGHAPGKASSLPAAVIAGMRAKLADPRGCASFHEPHAWVEQTYRLHTTYFVIWYTATHVLGARLAVARPTHLKKSPMPRRLFAPRSPIASAKPC